MLKVDFHACSSFFRELFLVAYFFSEKSVASFSLQAVVGRVVYLFPIPNTNRPKALPAERLVNVFVFLSNYTGEIGTTS